MAKKGDRITIDMACNDCKERNYSTSKNKRNDTARLERNKFCPRCGGYRGHKEVR